MCHTDMFIDILYAHLITCMNVVTRTILTLDKKVIMAFKIHC